MTGLEGGSGLGLMLGGGGIGGGGGGGQGEADGSGGLRQKGAILNIKGVDKGVASSRLPSPAPTSKRLALMVGSMDQCKAAFMDVNLALRPSGYLTQV